MWMLGIEASSNLRPHFSHLFLCWCCPQFLSLRAYFPLSVPCCGSAETWSDHTIPLNSLFAPHIHLLSSSVRPLSSHLQQTPSASLCASPAQVFLLPSTVNATCVPNPTLSFINIAHAKFSCLFLISTKFYIYYNLHTSPLPNFIVIKHGLAHPLCCRPVQMTALCIIWMRVQTSQFLRLTHTTMKSLVSKSDVSFQCIKLWQNKSKFQTVAPELILSSRSWAEQSDQGLPCDCFSRQICEDLGHPRRQAKSHSF